MNGRLGAYNLIEGIPQSIARCVTDKYASMTVNICNRSPDKAASVKIAITDAQSTFTGTVRYVEFNTPVAPSTSLSKTGILVNSGDYVTVEYTGEDLRAVSAVAYGVQSGETTLPDNITVQVDPAPTFVTPAGLIGQAEEGQPVAFQVLATDNRSIKDYALVEGALPTGLALNTTTGVIAGTPSGTDQTYAFTVRATDVVDSFTDQEFEIEKVPDQTGPTWVTEALASGQEKTAYSQRVEATDISTPVEYAITGGALPTGLALNTVTGIIAGIPATGTAGTSSVTITASDSAGNTTAQSFNLIVATEPSVLTSTSGDSYATSGEYTVHQFTSTGSTTFELEETTAGLASYALSTSVGDVDEGGSFSVLLQTANVSNGVTVPYTITGVDSADIGGASLTGNFTVNNNEATLIVNLAEDVTTEGAETFTITLDNGSSTVSVVINDTSTA
jgi:hypothetical protein